MKGNFGLVAVAVVIAALWMSRRSAAATTITPQRPSGLSTPQQESSLSGVKTSLVQKRPPSDVRQYELGPTTYAKFQEPIDVGGSFKQWGVTATGQPVVSMNPPESYDAWEWY